MFGIELVIMLLMIAFNSVFAAFEIALTAASLARLHMLAREGRPGAAAAAEMKENIEGSLATVQLGITLVGAVAAAVGGAGADEVIAPWLKGTLGLAPWVTRVLSIAMVVIPLTAVTIIVGELVPKVFALRNKEWICLILSPWMRWISYSVWPIVWLFETSVAGIVTATEALPFAASDREAHNEETHLQELRALAAMARASRLIGEREEQIILSAARLSSRPVREIVLPPDQISLLCVEDSLSECLISAHLEMHTRYPVSERRGDPHSIIGYVNFKDIVAALRINPTDPTLRGILRPILIFREDAAISACLETMIHERSHIALVKCEQHQVLGMVTLEDVTEELLGDIGDEHDRLATHVLPIAAGWIIGGGVSLERLHELTQVELSHNGADRRKMTVHAWMIERLGHPPHGGDEVQLDGLRFTVRKVRRQQIQELQVHRK